MYIFLFIGQSILSMPDENNVIREVAKFYEAHSVEELKKKFKAVGSKLLGVRNITSVFGLGYPFYGSYDVVKRIKDTVNEKGFSKAVLPDIDLLVVYTGARSLIDIQDPNIERKIMSDFENSLSMSATDWNNVYRELVEKHNIADRDADLFEEFSKGKLHIDIIPIPVELWENLPYLFHPDDIKHMRKLERDLLFTTEHIASKPKFSEHSKIPWKFLKNRLLHTIAENQGAGEDEVIYKILKNHPYWRLMEKFPKIKHFQEDKWRRALFELKSEGLVKSSDGKITLTQKGKTHYNTLLEKRKKVREMFIP